MAPKTDSDWVSDGQIAEGGNGNVRSAPIPRQDGDFEISMLFWEP